MTYPFIAGNRALCFVDTFGDRGGDGVDRLVAPPDLVAWLREAGLATDGLRQATDASLRDARALREAIHRCASAVIVGQRLPAADIARLNAAAAKPIARPRLVKESVAMHAARPVAAALSMLADDAIRLLAGPQRERIRRCPECHMIFVDMSPPGRRRWCSSANGCGNRAKVRRHRGLKTQGDAA